MDEQIKRNSSHQSDGDDVQETTVYFDQTQDDEENDSNFNVVHTMVRIN